MTDWKDIHPDFTYRLQKLWEQHDFTVEQVKQYIEQGLTPTDYDLANYCKRRKNYEVLSQRLSLDELKTEYAKNLDWDNITKGFKYWKEEWTEVGFSYSETKLLIEAGLNLYDYRYAHLVKKDNHNLTDINKTKIDEIIKKSSWKDIHPNFTFSNRKEWEKIGFAREEVKSLVEIGFWPEDYQFAKQWKEQGFTFSSILEWMDIGLGVEEYSFANYLKRQKGLDSKENHNLTKLREEYDPLHDLVPQQLQEEWIKRGFTYQEIKFWIGAGLEKNEVLFADYLRQRNCHFTIMI